jgi:hypothetical protein
MSVTGLTFGLRFSHIAAALLVWVFSLAGSSYSFFFHIKTVAALKLCF